VAPKGVAQQEYVRAIRTHDVVFGVGPAGTGKTYLAMASAVSALLERKYKRIILTRPAVEAGEKLGFLPGDLAEKVNPYLRPLYDALHDMMDMEKAQDLLARGTIEVAPLAFMRGRTLNASFVILDEAQNTTIDQMKMFLTRLGYDSKAVITGDVTQVDLPEGKRSGLSDALELLANVEGIAKCRFSDADVVRHPLVQRIIRAYDSRDEARREPVGRRIQRASASREDEREEE
jgi:phosphate starvation-inducible PhoH-like protein